MIYCENFRDFRDFSKRNPPPPRISGEKRKNLGISEGKMRNLQKIPGNNYK